MKKVIIWFGLIAAIFMCLAGLFIGTGHAATTSSKKNALGVVTITTDPNTTLVASLLGGEVHRDRDGRLGFNLRLHPRYTYALFDESVMFCGDIRSMLDKDGAVFAYTYRRAASRLIDGIPCHTLVGVDAIVERETK